MSSSSLGNLVKGYELVVCVDGTSREALDAVFKSVLPEAGSWDRPGVVLRFELKQNRVCAYIEATILSECRAAFNTVESWMQVALDVVEK